MRMRGGWVYIMADRYRGTLYIGVTSDLAARFWAHREGRGSKILRTVRLEAARLR
jgi:putative endonuclease